MVKTDSSMFRSSPLLVRQTVSPGVISRFTTSCLKNSLKRFFAEIDRRSLAFEVVVSVTQHCEVSAVLLEVETVGDR